MRQLTSVAFFGIKSLERRIKILERRIKILERKLKN